MQGAKKASKLHRSVVPNFCNNYPLLGKRSPDLSAKNHQNQPSPPKFPSEPLFLLLGMFIPNLFDKFLLQILNDNRYAKFFTGQVVAHKLPLANSDRALPFYHFFDSTLKLIFFCSLLYQVMVSFSLRNISRRGAYHTSHVVIVPEPEPARGSPQQKAHKLVCQTCQLVPQSRVRPNI